MSNKIKDSDFPFDFHNNDFGVLPVFTDEESYTSFDPDEVDCLNLPILPLRNAVLFPGQTSPIRVQRDSSVRLIRQLFNDSQKRYFGIVTQKTNQEEQPLLQDLYPIGVIAEIEAINEQGDGVLGIWVRGIKRFSLREITQTTPYLKATVELIDEVPYPEGDKQRELVMLKMLKEHLISIFELRGTNLPKPYVEQIHKQKSIAQMVNVSILATSIDMKHRQALLELASIKERGIKVLGYLQAELQMLRIKEQLINKAKTEVEKHNKEFFLQQQLRAIKEELGYSSNEREQNEIGELREQGKQKQWGEEVNKVFQKELRKAEQLNPHSPDYSVQIQYLRTMLSLPWGVYTQDTYDLKKAEKILNQQHFGLEKVKERILEHLAVLKLRGDMKSPIICLYGPPGVGKTSLGKSIAESLGRKYVRVSLGGVHDEAEIRGHRRTYIGAMCGRIIQSLQKAESSNPVFVLDEIDKLGGGTHKGDPSSALLEVLDPEQNTAFHDNYLDIDYDLSKVLFIATANSLSEISQPLRDRMEIIEVSGYIAEEKLQIAKRHLIPTALDEHGLSDSKLKFSTKAIETIIEEYTRESGVRTLNKRIAEVMRKVAWQKSLDKELPKEITPTLVRDYLGIASFQRDKYQGNEHPGVVVGLAWTSVGGDILYIESSLHQGQDGKLSLTGNLGDVMKESATLALSYIKSHLSDLGITEEQVKDKAIHIHVPMGAVPKDGPSAGITIATSLVSAITRRKVKAHIAMTGEITLRGKVLPVGGIKEKILAAKRSGIKEIIMCRENEKDILDIKESYRKGLTFHYVEHIKEVLAIALTNEIA